MILRSPEVSETVAYGELYFEVVNYYRWKKRFLNAIQWCYTMMTFSEQREDGMNRMNHRLDLAMEDFDVGLAMYSRMLHDDPGNVWLYNGLGLELRSLGLSSLAVEALKQGLSRCRHWNRWNRSVWLTPKPVPGAGSARPDAGRRLTASYPCMIRSRIPAISFQGISGYCFRRDSGKCFVASPTISKARTTAKLS